MKVGDLALKVYTAFIFMFLFAPIIVMIVFSFNNSRFLGAWKGFTLKWYYELFRDRELWRCLYNSIWVASLATGIGVVFAIPTAYVMSRYYFKGKTTIDSILYIPIVIPEIAEGLTLLLLYVWARIPRGGLTVMLGHAVWFPVIYIVIRARITGIPKVYEEAARVLGANEIQTFFRVILPLIAPGIISGGLLMFTWSFDDFIKAYFTTGPGFMTLPLKVWSMAARGGVTPELNALTTMWLIISSSLAIVYLKIQKK